MTIDLEERIRRAAQLLDHETIRPYEVLHLTRPSGRQTDRRWSVVVSVAAACMLVAGLFGMFLLGGRNPSSIPASSDAPSADVPPASPVMTAPPTSPAVTPPTVPPAATLPALADVSPVVPPTVFGTGPTDWYRLQPDLDVAWYSEGGTESMLCFRTPAGQECQFDEFMPTTSGGGPIGVRSVDNQLLVLTLDPGDSVTVTFDSGQALTAPVERDAGIGWAVARIQVPAGSSPDGLWMLFNMTEGTPATPVETTVPSSQPVATSTG